MSTTSQGMWKQFPAIEGGDREGRWEAGEEVRDWSEGLGNILSRMKISWKVKKTNRLRLQL